ncbi:MAG TPA: HEAT repeat domain-containing protein [Polyangiales bacterium]|nr:HEAT repeat domain-containing protein [Polyangiales bacterium]
MQRAQADEAQQNSARQPAENAQNVYVIKLLAHSNQFRVRAQAAISLGLMEPSAATREALTTALHDGHPAVRAAAATSLGRIGDATHVATLRKLKTDREQAVRNAASASIGRIETSLAETTTTHRTTASLSAATDTSRM